MEVAKPWEDIETETEDIGVSLRGRLPRHHNTTNDSPSTDIFSASTVVYDNENDDGDRQDDDKSSSLSSNNESQTSDDEKKTNGNAVMLNGHSNGDARSTNGHSGLDDRYVDFLVSSENPVDQTTNFEANDVGFQKNGVVIVVEDNCQDVNEIEKVEESSTSHKENGVLASSGSHETFQYMEARLRQKIEEEFRELYLDKLSDKQGQKEFYCPNCKACITKVLVRKQELKLELETRPPHERVDRFRCTSCFSFLIPIGNWLFPKWRVDEDDETMLDQDIPVSFGGLHEPLLDRNSQVMISKTPFPSVVTSVTTTIQPHEHKSRHINPHQDQHDLKSQAVSREIPVSNQPVVTSVTTITGLSESVQQRPWSKILFGQKSRAAIESRAPVPEEPIGITVPETTKLSPIDSDKIGEVEDVQSSDSSVNGTLYDRQPPVKELAGTVVSAAVTPIGSSFETGLKLEVSLPSHDLKGSLPDKITPELDRSAGDVLIVRSKASESDISVVSVSANELPLLQEVIVHTGTKPDVVVQAVDSGLAREELPRITSVTLGTRDTRLILEPGSPKSWEIIKSIVYGGLVESITSLGIVTSAASGDAATLSIVALALANLIGGLFVIAHNIWELRDEHSTVRSSLTNQMVDKYQEVLGRRENFSLHATFAILSFIMFGLIPPVIYGFTFRATDDKDLKLVAVGVASLICIAILAVGKAYSQRPNKYMKTVMYYLVVGFGVSGASYLAGELISQLMKKIESADTTPALAMYLSGTGSSNAY